MLAIADWKKQRSLYDAQIVRKSDGKVIASKKGFYDYERNIFIIPRLLPLTEEELKVVEMVGFERK